MTNLIECPQCRRRLRMREEFAGQEVKCPDCGTVWTPAGGSAAVPVDPPIQESPGAYSLAPVDEDRKREAPVVRPVEPRRAEVVPSAEVVPVAELSGATERCPNCGHFMTPEAVLCVECGFNRKTGKRLKTVSQRFKRHWDGGNFPLWGRLLAIGLLLAVSVIPLLFEKIELGILLLTIWGFLFLPLLGIFKRIIITRDKGGRAIVVLQWWIFFLPCYHTVTYLEDGYERIRTGARSGPGASLVMVVVLFLLCGIPGLLYAFWANRSVVTLEIAPSHDGPQVEPILVYRGSNDDTMRQIGDTLKQIAGLYYG